MVCILTTYLFNTTSFDVKAQEPGIVDLSDFDFSNQIARVAHNSAQSIYIYSGAFYSSEDFATGRVDIKGVIYDNAPNTQGDYGTLRMVLKLPPDEVYAIAAKNVSYAQRLFIDGKEYPSAGIPADCAEDVVPQSRRYIEAFFPMNETTEIIIHYAAFVHADGGGLYPMSIGHVEHVTRNEQLAVFYSTAVAAMLTTIMIFFFGLFLFFRSHRYLLWFSLLCGCIAIRQLSETALGVLLPDLNWFLAIRIAYISGGLVGIFAMLYILSLFSNLINKWVLRSFFVICAGSILMVAATPTTFFTRFPVELSLLYAGMIGYILLMALVQYARGKRTTPLSLTALRLLLIGFVIFALFLVLDIFTFQNSISLFGLEYQTVGMVLFLFINMLALVLGFSHTEQQVDILRKKELEITETNRMLERLSRAKSDFLGNVSHEMKTPLAVISNYAGLTRNQLRRNLLNEDSESNLDMIQQEAVRLGRLVERLMPLSMEKERQHTLTLTDAEALLFQAADFCDILCQGRGNRISVEVETEHIPLWVNTDGLSHVLVNLITNANRHTQNGVITLSAVCTEQNVRFEVSDTGTGIPPAILSRAFERGISGSGSSGLGLPICKEIIEEHGGSMQIESSESGTEVSFTLPRREGGEQI